MTISVRIKYDGISVDWGMFLSIGAAIRYMEERNYAHFEVLKGTKVVYTQ